MGKHDSGRLSFTLASFAIRSSALIVLPDGIFQLMFLNFTEPPADWTVAAPIDETNITSIDTINQKPINLRS
jgi:hypothetical protein